uniref:Uncharacterized protein n=1 Tax=Timema shepardi TaxID=629360 RepID=A0A7R9ATF5_TIMSH|nr:unnamed protein product [Timema shepardi]
MRSASKLYIDLTKSKSGTAWWACVFDFRYVLAVPSEGNETNEFGDNHLPCELRKYSVWCQVRKVFKPRPLWELKTFGNSRAVLTSREEIGAQLSAIVAPLNQAPTLPERSLLGKPAMAFYITELRVSETKQHEQQVASPWSYTQHTQTHNTIATSTFHIKNILIGYFTRKTAALDVTLAIDRATDDGAIGGRVENHLGGKKLSTLGRDSNLDVPFTSKPDLIILAMCSLIRYFSSHPPVYEKDTEIFVWNCALHSANDVVFDCCAHTHIGGGGDEGGTFSIFTASLVSWSEFLATGHEVSGLIPGTSRFFCVALGLEQVLEKIDRHWCYGCYGDKYGNIPSNYLISVDPPLLADTQELFAAVADFSGQQSGDLTFQRGHVFDGYDLLTNHFCLDIRDHHHVCHRHWCVETFRMRTYHILLPLPHLWYVLLETQPPPFDGWNLKAGRGVGGGGLLGVLLLRLPLAVVYPVETAKPSLLVWAGWLLELLVVLVTLDLGPVVPVDPAASRCCGIGMVLQLPLLVTPVLDVVLECMFFLVSPEFDQTTPSGSQDPMD